MNHTGSAPEYALPVLFSALRPQEGKRRFESGGAHYLCHKQCIRCFAGWRTGNSMPASIRAIVSAFSALGDGPWRRLGYFRRPRRPALGRL